MRKAFDLAGGRNGVDETMLEFEKFFSISTVSFEDPIFSSLLLKDSMSVAPHSAQNPYQLLKYWRKI